MTLNYHSILIFDFETTGLSPLKDKVIEIGAVKLQKVNDTYQIENTLEVLIQQKEPITDFISNLTGITNEMLKKEGIEEEIAFQMLRSLIDEDTLLVAYNLAFDIGFLLKLFQKYVSKIYAIENDILDCMTVYKDRYAYPHRLLNAAETFRIPQESAHRAKDDAYVTFLVLQALDQELSNLDKYVNVLGYNPKYRAPETYFFKKKVKVVPQGMQGERAIEKLI